MPVKLINAIYRKGISAKSVRRVKTVRIITIYDFRQKIEKKRLNELIKRTVVNVMNRLDKTYFQGTPPKILTIASRGKLIASSKISWNILLNSLPITICRLVMGVVISMPRVL